MKKSARFLTLLCALCWAVTATAAQRPNILLIFADDLGWKDVGYQGADFFETPNIDRLAKEGMVFSNAYAAAGNCAPSRACLLSGNYTPRHQVFAVGSTDRGTHKLQRLIPIPNKNGLGSKFVTIAEVLKGAGYATGIFGKWHLAGRDGALPTQQGFDESLDSFGEGPEKEGVEQNKKGPPEDPKGVYTLSRKACDFMTRHKDQPFFCYLAHHAIHSPQQGRPETLAHFQAKAPGEQHHDVMYAACTYDLDDSVGMVLKHLKDLGIEKNTLVIFTSDNGGTQASSQEPLRGNKGCYYEGGIREPFIARWPGVIKPGSKSDVPVINIDLFPTFLAAAGVPMPEDKVVDGESLVPLFKGKPSLRREAIFWHFPGYLDRPVIRGRELDVRTGFRSRPVSVIRKGDWKLILYHEEWQLDGGRAKLATNHAIELYNLKEDVGEHKDLCNVNTGKRDELLNDLIEWFETVQAQLPTQPNPDYDPTAPPNNGKGKGKGKGKNKKKLL